MEPTALVRPDLSLLGPAVIGATGGSGTRVVARIALGAGLYIGNNRNQSEDALDIAEYFDRWINAFVLTGNGLAGLLDEMMAADFVPVLETHCAGVVVAPQQWGWKEPRSIYLLPFLHRNFPAFRFLHVVRDGRDMAVSSNQNQLRKHGVAVLGPAKDCASQPVRSIALWSRVNLDAATYGEEQLGPNYLRLRFEDLCRDPIPTVSRILEFFALSGDVRQLASEVAMPDSLGRWHAADAETKKELERVGGDALEKFSYR